MSDMNSSRSDDVGASASPQSVSCADAPGRYPSTNAHEWVASQTGQSLSPLAKNVCDVLAFMGPGGIYNRPISFDRVDWSDDWSIELTWAGYLSNWDSPDLTALWAHCADRMIRVEVSPCSPRHLRLRFWQRRTREGAMMDRLPAANEQIAFVGAARSQGEEKHDG